MKPYQLVLGVLLFAVVTALLYIWGLKKTMTEQADLKKILIYKCSNKITYYIKKNGDITEDEIIRLIDGTKAGLFWSKNKLKITNAKNFSKDIIEYMLENKYIVKNGNKYNLK